jgi:uncharacterized protein (DUF1501 family)
MEMAFADVGGWDHHVNETGPRASEGQLANLLREYGQALAAFWQDMGDRMDDVALVTMSSSAARRAKTATAAPITATPIACSSWAAP